MLESVFSLLLGPVFAALIACAFGIIYVLVPWLLLTFILGLPKLIICKGKSVEESNAKHDRYDEIVFGRWHKKIEDFYSNYLEEALIVLSITVYVYQVYTHGSLLWLDLSSWFGPRSNY
tara:strand:+ start:222 stop:578 length:357 start_codon:yes stop_codon:yes gene_type:complete